MEGSSLVLEKNDSEDFCGDQEERSVDIVFYRLSADDRLA